MMSQKARYHPCLSLLLLTRSALVIFFIVGGLIPLVEVVEAFSCLSLQKISLSVVRRRRTLSSIRLCSSNINVDEATSSTSKNNNIKRLIVLNWDGCLADTVPWRIESGIRAANHAWPGIIPMDDDDDDDDDDDGALSGRNILRSSRIDENNNDWLRNKLSAISHVFGAPNSDVDVSRTCEYALATRLLVEEQRLDEGRSIGKSGKYASQFHPQQQQTSTNQLPNNEATTADTSSTSKTKSTTRRRKSESTSTTGSRPLTVGEIAANWVEGGMIRDTVRMKYHCNYKDPLLLLQEGIDNNNQIPLEDREFLPTVNPVLCEFLQQRSVSTSREHHKTAGTTTIVMVCVPHQSDLDVAQMTLREAGISKVKVATSMEQIVVGNAGIEDDDNDDDGTATLWLTVTNNNNNNNNKRKEETDEEEKSTMTTMSYREIVSTAPKDCTIHIVDSSWYSLQGAIELYGDYIPRQGNVGNCIFPDRRLSLNLAQWATNCHPSQQSAATMNPWTGVLTITDFEDLLLEVQPFM